MDLDLTPDQALLADTARAWIARRCPSERLRALEAQPHHDVELWSDMSELGWPGLPVPADLGGAGAGMLELALVAEELGRGAVPSPLLTSATLVTLPLLWSADERHDALVASLASGERIGSLALLEPGMRDEWEPVALSGGGRLSGVKILVPWGACADVLLVATADGPAVVEPEQPGVRVYPHDALGGDPLAVVELDGAAADLLSRDAALLRRALDHAAVADLAYAVGIADTMLALSVRHTTERCQFGRPIGAFQAVAHRCAEMRADVDACRWLAYQAAWALDLGHPNGIEVPAALSYAKDALRRISRHAHQVHGAIGFSTEHELQRFSRRAKAFELAWGGAARHRERLAAAMGLSS